MEKKVAGVSMAVGVIGVVSAALGFAAEATRTKANEIGIDEEGDCIYPSSPALGLGLTASLLLLIDQIIISSSTGCICCRRNHSSNSSSTPALLCFIFSWLGFVLAFLLLVVGTLYQLGVEKSYFNYSYCYYVKPGVFAAGSTLSIFTIILGLVSYVSITSLEKRNNARPSNLSGGVTMVQPQEAPGGYGYC